ncbi:MAG: ABC transporter permease subunit [Polyangiaceae bacterium]
MSRPATGGHVALDSPALVRASAARRSDKAFDVLAWSAGATLPLVVLAIATYAAFVSLDAHDVAGTEWSPALGRFGLAGHLLSTLASSLVALAIAAPISLAAATYLSELASLRVRWWGSALLDASAAIPAVVLGSWGRQTLVPLLPSALGEQGSPGFGAVALTAVLAMMMTPTIAVIALEVLRALPDELRETGTALGATPSETARRVLLPAARGGLAGAVLLGFGRAAGECVAVSMVSGGRAAFPPRLFGPASTLSSLLVDEYLDATHADHLGALAVVVVLLILVSGATSAAARRLVRKSRALEVP